MIRLLEAKVRHGISEAAIKEILDIFELSHLPSQHVAGKVLRELTGLGDTRIDCCVDSCVAFTGVLREKKECPCGEPRYSLLDKPRKSFQYISPIQSLLLQYADPERAKLLKTYSQSVINDPNLKDFWNGSIYRALRRQGYFSDPRDVCFIFATDGVDADAQTGFNLWPLLLFTPNLPPHLRVKKEYMLNCGFIPGPKNPGDLNTFLRPLVDDFKVHVKPKSILMKSSF